MILELLIFILTTVFVYYIYTYKNIHKYFKERDVKFLPGCPIFGNILRTTFQKRHFNDELDEVYNAYPEERYLGFAEFTMPVILVKDPEIIKNIVIKDFDYFTDHREFFSQDIDPLFAESLLLMKGDRWRNMRTTLSPAFTSSKMKYMLPFILEITNNIVQHLDEHQDEDIDVDDLSRRYSNDVIASAGYGLQVNSLQDRDNEFFTIGSALFDFTLKQQVILMLSNQFPEFVKKLRCRLFPDQVYKFFSDIVASAMEYRRTQKIDRPDMIQLLLEAKKEWTPAEMAGQVFIFFTAGYETSASAIVMALHELALNTDIQERLYAECKNIKSEELNFDNLSELKYLDAVINETLRKWSPAIILDRTCNKNYELPPPREGGKPYMLKPGDVLYNMVNQVQMDPKYWPEPHKYKPERFLEENKHKITPFTFMPFGVGPRACIGLRFAMMEIKVLIHHLILKYKVVKTEKTMDPIKLKPHNFKIKALDGTFVRFEKRQSE